MSRSTIAKDCCVESLQDFYVLASATAFASADLQLLLADPAVTAVAVPGIGGRPTRVSIPVVARHVRVQLLQADYLQLAEVVVFAVPQGGGR